MDKNHIMFKTQSSRHPTRYSIQYTNGEVPVRCSTLYSVVYSTVHRQAAVEIRVTVLYVQYAVLPFACIAPYRTVPGTVWKIEDQRHMCCDTVRTEYSSTVQYSLLQ